MKKLKGKPYHNRQRSSSRERPVDIRDTRQRFLIVCEGEKTEPYYFRKFRLKIDVKPLGFGYNTVSLVKQTIQLMSQDEYDQVWCVFDKDDNPKENFNLAIELARHKGIQVAYSNEAFELWYCLHFEYLNSGIPRKDYYSKLTEHLGKEYKKKDEDMYDNLLYKQEDAIKNAKRLLEQYDPSSPANDNPSTTVHRLVEELNRFIDYY